MSTLKWNGERWYLDERSLWKRVRQWVIWIGGWEKPNGKGWKFTLDYGSKKGWMPPFPVSLFGHFITFFGNWWQMRLWRGWYFTWSQSGVYVSSDGTPPREDKDNSGFYFLKKSYKRRRGKR